MTSVAPPVREKPARPAWIDRSTVCLLALLVGAAVFSAYQFGQTQQAQRLSLQMQATTVDQVQRVKMVERQAKAVELLIKYNDLMQQPLPSAKMAKKEFRYWRENLAVSLLGSLYSLTQGSREWETTIDWALEKHGRYLREQKINCSTLAAEFVAHLETALGSKAATFCRD